MSNDNTIAMPDLDFDTLPELAGFSVPPAGYYKLTLNIASKLINKKPAIELGYKVLEILEQSDPTEAPAKIGDMFSTAYFLDNDIAKGSLRNALAPLKEFAGSTSLPAIAEACKDLEVFGVVKVRKVEKAGADAKYYASVENIVVA